jgi:hypothetical protein
VDPNDADRSETLKAVQSIAAIPIASRHARDKAADSIVAGEHRRHENLVLALGAFKPKAHGVHLSRDKGWKVNLVFYTPGHCTAKARFQF